MGKHILELVQQIVVDFFKIFPNKILWLTIVGHQHKVSEWSSHVKLLDHGKHITDTAEISDTGVAKLRPDLIKRTVVVIAIWLASLRVRHAFVNFLETRIEQQLEPCFFSSFSREGTNIVD